MGPEGATYKYADEILMQWMDIIHNEERLPENVYMIGDNPASDIIGGNNYGWNTCLVRTGVFQGGENDEMNPANFGVFKNVLEAIKTAMISPPLSPLGTILQYAFTLPETAS